MQLYGPLAESFGNSDRFTAEAGLETSCHVMSQTTTTWMICRLPYTRSILRAVQ